MFDVIVMDTAIETLQWSPGYDLFGNTWFGDHPNYDVEMRTRFWGGATLIVTTKDKFHEFKINSTQYGKLIDRIFGHCHADSATMRAAMLGHSSTADILAVARKAKK